MKGLARKTHKPVMVQESLFGGSEPDWKDSWWGMPSFEMGDARPQYKIIVNFLTLDDLKEFAKKLGVTITPKSDSMWFPQQRLDEPKEWAYVE